MKMSPEELDKILKRPGYRAHDQSARAQPSTAAVSTALSRESVGRGKAARGAPVESKLERRMAQALATDGMPPYQRNYFFMQTRDYELDFAWPAFKVAIEVQGMAHRIKGKFTSDIQKRARWQLAGWIVIEVDREAITSGQALEWTIEHLRRRGVKSLP